MYEVCWQAYEAWGHTIEEMVARSGVFEQFLHDYRA